MRKHLWMVFGAGISAVFLQACAPILVRPGYGTLVPAAGISPSIVPGAGTSAGPLSSTEKELLVESAVLADIAYPENGIEHAIERFATLGYRAAYFASRKWTGSRYPEVFVLARPAERRIVLVFIGTNSFHDWLQNAKATRYEDIPQPGGYYLAPGHAGYRSGIRRLVRDDFFDETLPQLMREWGIATSEPIPVRLVGHSMGGGLSILAAPTVDGVRYTSGGAPGEIAVPDLSRKSGPFRVTEIVTFAPAYAMTICRVDRFGDFDHYEAYQREYGGRTYSVIKDDDMVPRLAAGGITRFQHVGHQIRITRDGEVVRETTTWRGGQNHALRAYLGAIRGDPLSPDWRSEACG